MNYPIWDLQWAGGGFFIATIAVFHVYISHFAIGGGLFLVLTEMLGYRRNSPGILEYTRRHTKFFLIVTMVLGGITGVGIWSTISLIHPTATSRLIHTFVFAWAIEWVFFLGEIVAILIYFYTFGKMERRKHLAIGWIYFFCAWMSLFVINGIIGFMLTPGDWLETRSIWDGFFNPSFWPSLAFRTFIALMFAGLYGFVTATWEKDQKLRETLVRHCALWLLLPFAFLLLSGWWYISILPELPQSMVLGANPELIPFFQGFLWISAILFVGGLIMGIRMPLSVKQPIAWTLLIIGLMYMGCFEWMREGGRRPYVIYGFMYSNSILVGQEDSFAKDGYLKSSGWFQHADITPENQLAAGQEIYRGLCSSCHSIGGPMNDIRSLTAHFDQGGMETMINGIGKVYAYMPRFVGSTDERAALAAYLVHEVNGHPVQKVQEQPERPVLEVEIPAFDVDEHEYVLLAWCTLGEKCISDSDSYFSFLPPGSTLMAQLILRDPQPEIITDNVELTFTPPPGFTNPSQHVEFWKYAKSLVGKDLPQNVSTKGLGLEGVMTLNPDNLTFVADGIPVLPYTDDGLVNPYPIFTIEAKSTKTGQVLATTKVVAPISTEIGCKNCHSGTWAKSDVTGIAALTASDILARHDKRHKTDLLAKAEAGQPVLCQSCHPDPLFNTEAHPGLLNLPAAIHGFHANYLSNSPDAEPCHSCHPTGPDSYTYCARGVHASEVGLTCVNCHGTLEDHALTLLKGELEAGKPKAKKLMQHVRPRLVSSVEDISPRTPWNDQPDCLTCHHDFERPETDNAFNSWVRGPAGLYRLRTDDAGIMCQACHGSTHAEYPASNAFHPELDSIQPLQYQGDAGPIGARGNCVVCHTVDMYDEYHHPNMLGDE